MISVMLPSRWVEVPNLTRRRGPGLYEMLRTRFDAAELRVMVNEHLLNVADPDFRLFEPLLHPILAAANGTQMLKDQSIGRIDLAGIRSIHIAGAADVSSAVPDGPSAIRTKVRRANARRPLSPSGVYSDRCVGCVGQN
jgi:hypothetical protein